MENPLATLLSFQKAKEEGRDLARHFKLFDSPAAKPKPASEERLFTAESTKKKLSSIKSLQREAKPERETYTSNFFQSAAQRELIQQQRIKDLEMLITRYDKKISKYSEAASPKLANAKVLRRIGGGYLG